MVSVVWCYGMGSVYIGRIKEGVLGAVMEGRKGDKGAKNKKTTKSISI